MWTTEYSAFAVRLPLCSRIAEPFFECVCSYGLMHNISWCALDSTPNVLGLRLVNCCGCVCVSVEHTHILVDVRRCIDFLEFRLRQKKKSLQRDTILCDSMVASTPQHPPIYWRNYAVCRPIFGAIDGIMK